MIVKVYQRYIDQIIHSFNVDKKSKKSLFVKHFNTFNITKEDFDEIVCKYDSNIQVLFHEYDENKMQHAYEPVLGWIRDLYINKFKEELSIEEFLDECQVYPLQKSILQSYIEKGICKRKEDVVVPELKFEHEQFILSIVKIICYISLKTPLIIVLNKLHASNQSILEFLNLFLESDIERQIALIATYNEAYDVNSYMNDTWTCLLDKVESINKVFEWGIHEEQRLFEYKNSFLPVVSELEEYIICIDNMVQTLALEQAIYYLDLIYNKLDIDNLPIDNLSKRKFLEVYALTNIYLDNISNALLLCDSIRNLCDIENDKIGLFNSNYICGLAQITNEQYIIGENIANKCRKIANELNDSFLIFKSELLKYMSLFRGRKGLFLFGSKIEIKESFLEEIKSYGYDNHLAYIYVFGYENDDDDEKEFEKEKPFIQFDKGIQIAQKLQNDRFILLAYKKMIAQASCHGNFDIADDYYKKCIDVAKKLDDKGEETEIYNGIGYNSIVRERYIKANKNFNSALKILYEMNSVDEISETLYNMGVNAFVAGNYEKAREYLLLVLKLIEHLNQVSIRVCNISKIYGLIALSNYYLDVEYNCYVYFNKMRRVLMHLLEPDDEVSCKLWDDDLFLYYLIKAIIEKREKKYSLAEESFKKAEHHMHVATGSMFYTYALLASERAEFYRTINDEENAKKVLAEAMEYCKNNRYEKRFDTLCAQYHNDEIKKQRYELELTDISTKEILNLAKRVGIEIESYQQKKELSFLGIWQNTLSRDFECIEDLIICSMETLQNNFCLERMIFINAMPNSEVEVVFSDKHTDLSDDDAAKIVDYFKNNDREFIVCRNEKNIERYDEIVNIFGRNQVFSMIGMPIFVHEELHSVLLAYIPVYSNFVENKFILNERHLFIIRYIFKQLLDAISKFNIRREIEEINRKLHANLITDILTKVYNRQGLDKIIKANNVITTILYVDLDNFKIYNDTFGHDVGDYILVCFAELFKHSLLNEGYVARYGGDEFILGIPNATSEAGVAVAKRIFEAINSKKFIDKVKKRVDKYDTISEDDRVSCSIGIATSESGDKESLLKAITNADKALYDVKKTTKKNYKVWVQQ